MDEPGASEADLDASLRFIRAINRRLGGSSSLVKCLARWSAAWPAGETIEILDLGTGSADIPVAVVRWARAKGLSVRVTGVDLHPVTLELGRRHVVEELGETALAAGGPIELVEADAFGLVDRVGVDRFDYVHAGMFLHHFSELRVLTLLAIMNRLARRGVVWNDLVRSRVARAGIHALTVGQRPIVKHDARVSVEAGFTPSEAGDLCARAGIEYARVEWSFVQQRFTAAGEQPWAWK